ncbi:MAG: hypothetical protein ACI32O_00605 [Enterococcus sp.]
MEKVSKKDLNQMADQVLAHSTYDEKTGMYILNHSIVEQGIITEQQYNDVKEVEKVSINLLQTSSGKQARLAPLILAAIAVIKVAAIFIGVALANQLISYVSNWGVSAFCKAYKNKHSTIKSFCSANGF